MRFQPCPLSSLAAILDRRSGRLGAGTRARRSSQLNTRLKLGDTVWVTDAQGREIKGKIRDSGRPR